MSERMRCSWCNSDPLYIAYHDEEWGVPLHDDGRLFELLCLEGQQAGLSWITVLKKREHYRKLFSGFVPRKVAAYTDEQLELILTDTGVVRNRLKIYGIRKNAVAYCQHFAKAGSFNQFLWHFAEPLQHQMKPEVRPVSTPESDAMAKALKKLGFTFVGTTICYAFMQASGMVNDHASTCWKY